jgi:hypothetical protein
MFALIIDVNQLALNLKTFTCCVELQTSTANRRFQKSFDAVFWLSELLFATEQKQRIMMAKVRLKPREQSPLNLSEVGDTSADRSFRLHSADFLAKKFFLLPTHSE